MSNSLKVVAPVREEVTALVQTCTDLAVQYQIDRYELAVKSRLEAGIPDDNELRKTDELLREIVRGADAIQEGTEAEVSAAHALHHALIAEVKKWIYYNDKTKEWEGRWGVLRTQLTRLILKYGKDKEDLARRQQEELNRAAEEERQRKSEEARLKLRDGDVAGAKAAISQANTIVTPIISQARPVLDHSSPRKPWQAEVENPEMAALGIAAGILRQMSDKDRAEWIATVIYAKTTTIPISVIKEWDLGFIRKEAAKRGGLNWPGVRAWQEDKLAVSRR